MDGPPVVELTVTDYLKGARIDRFLARELRNYTPFRLQRMVRHRAVTIDGHPARADQRVFTGQRITARLIEPPDKLYRPEPIPLEILYEDRWLVVVNKPAAMAVHPVADIQAGTLANALQHHLDRQTPFRGLLRPGIVHRLDAATSGVIVVSKDHLTHRRLSIDFQRRRIAKRYVAVVEGVIGPSAGEIDLPIGRLAGGLSILRSAAPDAVDPRPAVTTFRVIDRFAAQTLVELTPRTGRNHQIRVHLAAIGHPVVGDAFYGPTSSRCCGASAGSAEATARDERCQSIGVSAPPSVQRGRQAAIRSRHLLHASRLELVHPRTNRPVVFEAPLPTDFRETLDSLSMRNR